MNWWPRRKRQNAIDSFSKRTSLDAAYDVDILALHERGTSYAIPEAGRRFAEWVANFSPQDRTDAIIRLRNASAHGYISVGTVNFDALIASQQDAFPLERRSDAVPVVDSEPPAGAQYLLLLLPKKYREALLGDLEEEYRTVVLPQYGPLWAKVYYWAQVLWSFLPILWRLLEQIAFRS